MPDAIGSRLIIWVLILAAVTVSGAGAADVCDIQVPCTGTPVVSPTSGTGTGNGTICIYHFYGNGCPPIVP